MILSDITPILEFEAEIMYNIIQIYSRIIYHIYYALNKLMIDDLY